LLPRASDSALAISGGTLANEAAAADDDDDDDQDDDD
jgi:hypothetical protein